MTKFTLFLGLIINTTLFGQDTTYWAPPDNYRVHTYNATENTWLKQDFSDDTLFYIEELDSSKHFPTGKYIGYYTDGTIAFKRTCYFDGEYSYLHGQKKIYYPNGNLKEKGKYHMSIRIGKWAYFYENGDTLKTVDYYVPADTLTNYRKLINPPISSDTILIPERNKFMDTWPIINYGKNGFEVNYKNNSPIKQTLYRNGIAYASEKLPKVEYLSFGMGPAGMRSEVIENIEKHIRFKSYDKVLLLLESSSTADQFVGSIVCSKLAKDRKLKLTPQQIEKITLIQASDVEISFNSGCTCHIEISIKKYFDGANPCGFRDSMERWLKWLKKMY